MTDRKVTELDFRIPAYRDAKPEDYEFRSDGAIVRKDRWECAVQTIRREVGIDGREFEISDVIEAVRAIKTPKLMPADEWHEDFRDVLMFHFENFNEPPEVKCGGYTDIPENDPEYWTHFARYDFDAIVEAASTKAAL